MTKDNKTAGGVDIFESPEALQDQLAKTQQLAKSNQKILVGIAGVVLALVGGIIFYQLNRESKNRDAQVELFPAQFYFEKDSLQKGVNGDGNSTIGFVKIADEFSGTDAAELANFYLGVSKLKEGKYAEAAEALENFNAKDYLVQARAYSLLGDAYMELNKLDEAVTNYKKAANYYPNAQFSPAYLLKLAGAYEAKNDKESAIETYKQLIDNYAETQDASTAKKLLAKVEQQKAN